MPVRWGRSCSRSRPIHGSNSEVQYKDYHGHCARVQCYTDADNFVVVVRCQCRQHATYFLETALCCLIILPLAAAAGSAAPHHASTAITPRLDGAGLTMATPAETAVSTAAAAPTSRFNPHHHRFSTTPADIESGGRNADSWRQSRTATLAWICLEIMSEADLLKKLLIILYYHVPTF